MIPLESWCLGAIPGAGPQSDQKTFLVPWLISVAIHDASLVVGRGTDRTQSHICDVIDEFNGQARYMKVRCCKHKVHELVSPVPVVRCLGVPVKVGNRLHTLDYVQALLNWGPWATGRNIIFYVFNSLRCACHIATGSCRHRTRFGSDIFMVERELHVNFIHRLLGTLWVAALFVRVNHKHTMLAAAPAPYISLQAARWISGGSKLRTALDGRVRIFTVNLTMFHINFPLRGAGTFKQQRALGPGRAR
mmetsp:Transcript_12994/g.30913  ORF Transcript_12994/g.30913 Transcript_12994/m.30913 type:complete len:248 (+) Transcript_12994:246-989(+)